MKKILALLMCLVMVFALFACGETSTDTGSTNTNTDTNINTDSGSGGSTTTTDTNNGSTTSTSSKGSIEVVLPEDTVANKVIAIDQIAERAVIYDFDDYEKGDTLDDLIEWELPIGHAAGIKYREDTVFGDVVIVGGTKSGIYQYPSKKQIWATTNSGNNTHSVEILPSGNLVLANSTGNSLRFFKTSEVLSGGKGQSYIDYPLDGAHGVIWDPEYEVVWAIGNWEIVAYRVSGSGANERLVRVDGMGCNIQGTGITGSGHDLTADMTNTRYLYFTAGGAYRFDKEENKVQITYSYSSSLQYGGEIKGFSNNANAKFFSTGALGGEDKFFEGHSKEAWLTDTIIFYYKVSNKGSVKYQNLALTSADSAFYKVRAFCGQYQ